MFVFYFGSQVSLTCGSGRGHAGRRRRGGPRPGAVLLLNGLRKLDTAFGTGGLPTGEGVGHLLGGVNKTTLTRRCLGRFRLLTTRFCKHSCCIAFLGSCREVGGSVAGKLHQFALKRARRLLFFILFFFLWTLTSPRCFCGWHRPCGQ